MVHGLVWPSLQMRAIACPTQHTHLSVNRDGQFTSCHMPALRCQAQTSTCRSVAGFQSVSKRMRRLAPTRLRPAPPALAESSSTCTAILLSAHIRDHLHLKHTDECLGMCFTALGLYELCAVGLPQSHSRPSQHLSLASLYSP